MRLSNLSIFSGLVLFFLTSVSPPCFAQITLSGNVLDADSKEPLPYVNIGILGKNIGTTSNGKGDFELTIPAENLNDSIRFSMIGYASKDLAISDLRKTESDSLLIYLAPQAFELVQPTVVAGRFTKTKILGNKANKASMVVAFLPVKGFEVGSKIKIKKSPTIIKKFGANLVKQKIDSMVFRLNFYSVKDGKPHKSILNENILITNQDVKNKRISIDLSPYNIIVEDDFFVTMECVDYYGENELDFCGSLIMGPRIHGRETSQGDWKKVNLASIAFNVTVKY